MEHEQGFGGRAALVVGGASGMGNAVVRLLASQGARTHVFDIKETTDGEFHRCDVQDYTQVRRCVQDVVQRLGTADEIGKAVLFMLSDDCRYMTARSSLSMVATRVNDPIRLGWHVSAMSGRTRGTFPSHHPVIAATGRPGPVTSARAHTGRRES